MSDNNDTGARRDVSHERKSIIHKEKKPTERTGRPAPAEDAAEESASKLPKKKRTHAELTDEQRESRNSLIVALITLLVALSMAFAMFTVFVLDVGGIKTYTADLFLKQDDYYITKMVELNNKTLEYDKKLAEAEAVKTEYAEKLDAVNKYEQQLQTKDVALTKLSNQLDEREKSIASFATDMDQLIAIIEKLDPASAAQMLESLDDKGDAVIVLSKMDIKRSAAILEKMKTEVSSQITEMMLQKAE